MSLTSRILSGTVLQYRLSTIALPIPASVTRCLVQTYTLVESWTTWIAAYLVSFSNGNFCESAETCLFAILNTKNSTELRINGLLDTWLKWLAVCKVLIFDLVKRKTLLLTEYGNNSLTLKKEKHCKKILFNLTNFTFVFLFYYQNSFKVFLPLGSLLLISIKKIFIQSNCIKTTTEFEFCWVILSSKLFIRNKNLTDFHPIWENKFLNRTSRWNL